MKQLSILMCTIPDRECNFLGYLQRDDIEFIWLGDNYSMSIGEKRQKLLECAKGKYVCFVDDDDMISIDYVDEILKVSNQNRDCIVFNVMYKNPKRQFEKLVEYSVNFSRDSEEKHRFLRLPNHLMPIKREIALKVGFKNMGYGEDADYAKRLKPYLRSEAQINKTLYTYVDNPDTSKSRYSNRR